MLHEVLLALSGHPSPVLDSAESTSFPLLSPAESALLSSLGRLATLHRALKSHLPRISSYHPSLICRALATSISSTHLSAFQRLILDTERQILAKDSTIVGAYDIVPLASILNTFEPWKRKLDWYWEIACFMYSADAEPLTASAEPPAASACCTGPAVLNKLRLECRTGYPDIEEAALALVAVAERAWVRQLSTWLMHRRVASSTGPSWDFYIGQSDTLTSAEALQASISHDSLPSFVTKDTALSIRFIGRTLQMLRSDKEATVSTSLTPTMSELSLKSDAILIPQSFVQNLASLASPITPASFSGVISSLRSSVTAALVDSILPVHHLIKTLGFLRKFLLAGRSDFTELLIIEADRHIAQRHAQSTRGLQPGITNQFVGIVMKEAEVGSVLSKTWAAIAPMISKAVAAEEEVEWGRDHLKLKILEPGTTSARRRRPCAFESSLLHTPTALCAQLESAFDLFLGPDDSAMYSDIHSYLTAIRRTHYHLSDLWRLTPFRRDHPAPVRRGRASKAFPIIREKRRNAARRMHKMRDSWTTCNAAVRVLATLGDYLAGEVAERCWNKFYNWAVGSSSGKSTELPHDPEVIAQAHRQYLEGLVESLLLSDQRYVTILKSLLEQTEQMVALVKKLGELQRSIDLHDEGVMDGARGKLEGEEQDTFTQLGHGGASLNTSLRRLKEHLRDVSMEQGQRKTARNTATGFEPYAIGSGLDRLLMRLEPALVQQEVDEQGTGGLDEQS